MEQVAARVNGMAYLALTFWLLICVLIASGVRRLGESIVPPRVLNVLLLPGTLVAQLGHVLGLLVTGATITNTSLLGDDPDRQPVATTDARPRLPVIGPVLVGLLPLVGCAVAIHLLTGWIGAAIVGQFNPPLARPSMPATAAGVWQLLRDQITLAERGVNCILSADPLAWQSWMFWYLLICFAVRLAPFPGQERGVLGAAVVLGLGAALLGYLVGFELRESHPLWGVLNLTLGVLTALLLAGLLVNGVRILWRSLVQRV